jgi:hypothetical protein
LEYPEILHQLMKNAEVRLKKAREIMKIAKIYQEGKTERVATRLVK